MRFKDAAFLKNGRLLKTNLSSFTSAGQYLQFIHVLGIQASSTPRFTPVIHFVASGVRQCYACAGI